MILLKQTDYAYSSAYIRALENKLLSKTDIEALVLASDFMGASRVLRDKGYSDREITPENIDEVLKENLENARAEAIWASPKDNALNIFLYKNDFHNLKAILKNISSGNKNPERFLLTPTTVDSGLITEAVANVDFSSLPEHLKEVGETAFDILNRLNDGALADSLIDKACMDYMLKEAEKTKNEFLIGLIRLENTMSDIKIAERSAKMMKDRSFLESALSEKSDIDRDGLILASISNSVSEFLEKTGKKEASASLAEGLREFEKFSDNTINEYINKAKLITFGVEPVIAYIHRKQQETGIIRVILSAKQNGISEEELRTRLRNI